VSAAHLSTTVTAPHYISEYKSDMRGIRPGWHAIEDDGNIFFWTFFQPPGVHQENHSADELNDGFQVAMKAELKHFPKYRTHNERLSKLRLAFEIPQTF
jgi:hypothetical protein